MDEILIVGLLSYESPEYWRLCHQCIEATTQSSQIKYLIGLDRVDQKRIEHLQDCVPGLTTTDISLKPKAKKETTHQKRIRIGQLYTNVFKEIPDRSRYVFSLDGDIALTYKGWDDLLKKELDNRCVVIGHEYGKRWPEKYQAFPCLQCSFFDWGKIKDLKLDFRGHGKLMRISTKEESKVFGLPVGTNMNRDIGWQWPLVIKSAGYDGKTMQIIRGESKDSQILHPHSEKDRRIYKQNKKDNIKGLFEIHWEGKAIGSHLTKSTCLEFNTHPVSKYWVQRVRKYIGLS